LRHSINHTEFQAHPIGWPSFGTETKIPQAEEFNRRFCGDGFLRSSDVNVMSAILYFMHCNVVNLQ